MSVRWSQRRSWIRVNLWVHTLGPLNVPIHSEAVIEVSESDFDLETLNGLWSGSPHSKDLTRAPRGSLVFGFTSLAHTRSCARKLLGFKVATPPPPPIHTLVVIHFTGVGQGFCERGVEVAVINHLPTNSRHDKSSQRLIPWFNSFAFHTFKYLQMNG